jgi:hypothetical protein
MCTGRAGVETPVQTQELGEQGTPYALLDYHRADTTLGARAGARRLWTRESSIVHQVPNQ